MTETIARSIDHTLLRADATRDEIGDLCAQASEYGFAAVCVNPCWVDLAVRTLASGPVAVATVCGFPLGASATADKVAEATRAVESGAREVDMVIHLGAARAGDWNLVGDDVAAVAEALTRHGAVLKTILECGLFEDDEVKVRAAEQAILAGAHYVKTSTGFLAGGATLHDVALLRRVAGSRARVKASGGIRNLGQARAMLAAGADRLGTSSGVGICTEARTT